MAQMNYGYLKKASPGQLGDINPLETISKSALTALSFGVVVERVATDENQCQLFQKVGDVPLGITGRNIFHAIPNADTGFDIPNIIKQNSQAGIVRNGYLYVTAQADCKAGDDAYAVPVTGLITNSSTGNQKLGNSTFEEDGSAGDTVMLRVKL